jgi:PIN domain nuclease of toxin-antitoxin system
MILLDTHMLVWLLIAPENLSPKAKKAILAARKSGPLALSAISLWEIAWLAVNKRIGIDVSVDSFVKKCASLCAGSPDHSGDSGSFSSVLKIIPKRPAGQNHRSNRDR